MGVFDLFSKRRRRERGEVPDIYVYDNLPMQLRVQIVHIIRDAFGVDHYGKHYADKMYGHVEQTLCREYGLFELVKHSSSNSDSVLSFFLQVESIENALDVIELCFKIINIDIPNNFNYQYHTDRKLDHEDAITELNERFKEHGVGYQFESNELIRIDSNYLHVEAVKPTLTVLRGGEFKGANQEFLRAHEHYRHCRYKECITEALKAFESTMKAICKIRGWPVKPNDAAKALINTCFERGLLPSYLESQMGSLRSLLESGIPTVRNKLGGHGQGPDPTVVPEYVARYAMNLTAASILFLVEANSATK